PWANGGAGTGEDGGGGDPPFPEEDELWPSEEETGFWSGDAPDEEDPFPEDPPEEDTPGEGEEPSDDDPDEDDPLGDDKYPYDPPPLVGGEDPGTTVGGFGLNAPRVRVPAYGVVYDWRRVLRANPETGWDEVGRELRRLRNAGVRYVRVQFPFDAGVTDLDAEVAPQLDPLVGRAAAASLYVLPVLLRFGTR